MEGQGEIVKDDFPHQLIILFHCLKKSLFIADDVIVDEVVMNPTFKNFDGFDFETFIPKFHLLVHFFLHYLEGIHILFNLSLLLH